MDSPVIQLPWLRTQPATVKLVAAVALLHLGSAIFLTFLRVWLGLYVQVYHLVWLWEWPVLWASSLYADGLWAASYYVLGNFFVRFYPVAAMAGFAVNLAAPVPIVITVHVLAIWLALVQWVVGPALEAWWGPAGDGVGRVLFNEWVYGTLWASTEWEMKVVAAAGGVGLLYGALGDVYRRSFYKEELDQREEELANPDFYPPAGAFAAAAQRHAKNK